MIAKQNIQLGYYTSKQDWKELLEQLKSICGLTVADMPPTDSEGLFLDSQYVTVEYKNQFYYVQKEIYGSCFQVTPYIKISPWEKQQADYSSDVTTSADLLGYIKAAKAYAVPLTVKNRNGRRETCPKQRLYLTDGFYRIYPDGSKGMQHFRAAMGFRERDIFERLERIENTMTTKEHKVLRFWAGKNYFDWECKSGRITG